MIGDFLKILSHQLDQGVGVEMFSHGSFGFGGQLSDDYYGTVNFTRFHGDLLCKILISHRKIATTLSGACQEKNVLP